MKLRRKLVQLIVFLATFQHIGRLQELGWWSSTVLSLSIFFLVWRASEVPFHCFQAWYKMIRTQGGWSAFSQQTKDWTHGSISRILHQSVSVLDTMICDYIHMFFYYYYRIHQGAVHRRAVFLSTTAIAYDKCAATHNWCLSSRSRDKTIFQLHIGPCHVATCFYDMPLYARC